MYVFLIVALLGNHVVIDHKHQFTSEEQCDRFAIYLMKTQVARAASCVQFTKL